MKKLILAALAATALAGAAGAADMAPRPALKAEPVVVVPWTWSGIWLGGNVGGALVRTDVNTIFPSALGITSGGSFHNNGLLLGGELDARYQSAGSSLVFGLDAIIDWANTKGGDGGCSALVIPMFSCVTKNSYFGFVGGEIGITSLGGQTAVPFNPANLTPLALPFGNAKVSVLSGMAFRDFKFATTDVLTGATGSERHTVFGFAPGLALDVAVTPNIAVGFRYLHPFWKGNSCAGALTAAFGTAAGCTFKEKEDVGMVAVTYKLPVLGGVAQPLLSARY